MHPDDLQLATYLDLPSDAPGYQELRAHVLTCSRCAARLALLREDSRRIPAALAGTGDTPDVRAAVRARLRRGGLPLWLGQGAQLALMLAGVLVFALLLAARTGTAAHRPDALFVADRRGERIVALSPEDGAQLAEVALGAPPLELAYDARRDRLYVLAEGSVIAVEGRRLALRGRLPLAQIGDTSRAGMALDERRDRQHVTRRDGVTALALDGDELAVAAEYATDFQPAGLVLASDGQALYTLDAEELTLWKLDLATGAAAQWRLSEVATAQSGKLALDRERRRVLVLQQAGLGGEPPALWAVDEASGAVQGPLVLASDPPAWDLLPLPGGLVAVARGDGRRGGVEVLSLDRPGRVAQISPGTDEHSLVAGPGGVLFGLNWLHGTVARYDTDGRAVSWRTPPSRWQPWDGVFAPGGWELR
ncbi:MAG: hypothetical protein DIU80_022675 [Chloroflexota bacterium]